MRFTLAVCVLLLSVAFSAAVGAVISAIDEGRSAKERVRISDLEAKVDDLCAAGIIVAITLPTNGDLNGKITRKRVC